MMSSSTVRSDEDLRERLRAFNYSTPPITESTRAVLIKKLEALEQAGRNGSGQQQQRRTRGNQNQHLMDYSSAEEDPPHHTPAQTQKRRISGAARNASTSASRAAAATGQQQQTGRATPGTISAAAARGRGSRGGTPVVSQESKRAFVNGHSGGGNSNSSQRQTRLSAKAMLSYSEEEESEEDEEEDLGEEEEDVDEEDGSDDDEDEDEEEDDEEDDDRIDFGGQTSPGMDSSSPNSPSSPDVNNGGLHYRGRNSNPSISPPNSGRFASSTPVNPVRSTANFLTPVSRGSNPSTGFSIMSPQLRAIANSREFGSLGEVLAASQPIPPPNGNASQQQQQQQQQALTQARPNSNPNANNEFAEKSSVLNSTRISKIIILLACFFFAILFIKYTNLRPSIDIASKLPMCSQHQQQSSTCVNPADKSDILELYRAMIRVLENRGSDPTCGGNSSSSQNLSYKDLISALDEESVKAELMPLLLELLAINPGWGVRLLDGEGKDLIKSVDNLAYLALTHPTSSLMCRLAVRLQALVDFISLISVYVVYLTVTAGVVYVSYRIYVWRKERQLQDTQEVFELVEQVLSLLVAQHQLLRPRDALGRPAPPSPGSPGSRPWVAVSHIHHQLIPPQDRKRRQRVWDKVVRYIRESESRVREDVQILYGEEHRVWQWLPDIQWSPLTHPGPNPYINPAFVPRPMTSSPPPSVSPPPQHQQPPTSSPHWQGSAFGALGRNVAAPAVAPTCCLKVRHLFDTHARKTNGPGWVWAVKEEVLRRCATQQASVVHVAVDTESVEGCVYVKAASTDDAGKVFRTLHGQWYKGNLVTVKYLREERYNERFPDAKFQKNALRSQT